jgi:hypothetical protein
MISVADFPLILACGRDRFYQRFERKAIMTVQMQRMGVNTSASGLFPDSLDRPPSYMLPRYDRALAFPLSANGLSRAIASLYSFAANALTPSSKSVSTSLTSAGDFVEVIIIRKGLLGDRLGTFTFSPPR